MLRTPDPDINLSCHFAPPMLYIISMVKHMRIFDHILLTSGKGREGGRDGERERETQKKRERKIEIEVDKGRK